MMSFTVNPTPTFTWYRVEGPGMDSKANWPNPTYATRGILLEVVSKGVSDIEINGKRTSVFNEILADKFFAKYYPSLVQVSKDWVEEQKAIYRERKKAKA